RKARNGPGFRSGSCRKSNSNVAPGSRLTGSLLTELPPLLLRLLGCIARELPPAPVVGAVLRRSGIRPMLRTGLSPWRYCRVMRDLLFPGEACAGDRDSVDEFQ